MLLHEYFYSEIKERVDMKGTEHYVGGVLDLSLDKKVINGNQPTGTSLVSGQEPHFRFHRHVCEHSRWPLNGY